LETKVAVICLSGTHTLNANSHYLGLSIFFWGENMNSRIYAAILSAILATLGLVACQKTEPASEGPAEKVGQKIDEAASKAAVHINAIAEKAGEGLSKAGEKIEQTAKDAQKENEEQKSESSK
jgi:hypothetical protein